MCGQVRSDERRCDSDIELVLDLPSSALQLLHRAAIYASNASRSPWFFAVGVEELRMAGISDSDLRWLCCKGYAEHAFDLSEAGSPRRMFENVATFSFNERSSFILTDSGCQLVRRLTTEHDSPQSLTGNRSETVANGGLGDITASPRWDVSLRELWVGPTLVKRFSVPAPNQERILMAFQEEAWPTRIDDPLPPTREITPKRRLHSTIQCLNRNQKSHLIRFHGVNCGRGIRWNLSHAHERGV